MTQSDHQEPMMTDLPWMVNNWTHGAIEAFRAVQEDVGPVVFGVTMQAFPDPAREIEDGWIPQVLVYLEIEGVKPGTSVYGTSIFRPFALTEALVTDFVTTALSDMMARREAARQQYANKAGEPPQQPVER